LVGDTVREANSSEVKDLRRENEQLKQGLSELYLKNRYLKKSCLEQGIDPEDI
jgi:transposase